MSQGTDVKIVSELGMNLKGVHEFGKYLGNESELGTGTLENECVWKRY